MTASAHWEDGNFYPLFIEQKGTLLRGSFTVESSLELRKLIERLKRYEEILEAEEAYERGKPPLGKIPPEILAARMRKVPRAGDPDYGQ